MADELYVAYPKRYLWCQVDARNVPDEEFLEYIKEAIPEKEKIAADVLRDEEDKEYAKQLICRVSALISHSNSRREKIRQ